MLILYFISVDCKHPFRKKPWFEVVAFLTKLRHDHPSVGALALSQVMKGDSSEHCFREGTDRRLVVAHFFATCFSLHVRLVRVFFIETAGL